MATYCALHVRTEARDAVVARLCSWLKTRHHHAVRERESAGFPEDFYGEGFCNSEEAAPTMFSVGTTPSGWVTAHFNSFGEFTTLARELSAACSSIVVAVMAQSVSEAYLIEVSQEGRTIRTLYYAGDQGEWVKQEGAPLAFETQPLGTDIAEPEEAEPFYIFGREDVIDYCKNLGLELWGDDSCASWRTLSVEGATEAATDPADTPSDVPGRKSFKFLGRFVGLAATASKRLWWFGKRSRRPESMMSSTREHESEHPQVCTVFANSSDQYIIVPLGIDHTSKPWPLTQFQPPVDSRVFEGNRPADIATGLTKALGLDGVEIDSDTGRQAEAALMKIGGLRPLARFYGTWRMISVQREGPTITAMAMHHQGGEGHFREKDDYRASISARAAPEEIVKLLRETAEYCTPAK